MLHTINKSPFDTHDLKDCTRFISDGDVILLLEDGVYAAEKDTIKSELITNILKTNTVYALSPDLKARGLSHLIEGIKTADYGTFVDLVEEHKVQAWH